jgi:hypothetical protein
MAENNEVVDGGCRAASRKFLNDLWWLKLLKITKYV